MRPPDFDCADRRARPRVAAVILVLLLVACQSDTLSPAEASRQITQHLTQLPTPTIRIYRAQCVDKYFERFRFFLREDFLIGQQYQALETAGFVTQVNIPATQDRCGTPYPESLRILGITLTEKGMAEDWPEHQDRDGGWDIPVGRRAFVDVTDIRPEPDPAVMQVAYRWRILPTPGGVALGQRAAPYESRALFRRDATGWHLSTAQQLPNTAYVP